jgi:hypothetical protein
MTYRGKGNKLWRFEPPDLPMRQEVINPPQFTKVIVWSLASNVAMVVDQRQLDHHQSAPIAMISGSPKAAARQHALWL